MKLIFLCLLLLRLFISSATSNIFAVFPVYSWSHQMVFRVITEAISNHGQNMVVWTPDPRGSRENLKELDLHNVSYKNNNHRSSLVSKFGKTHRLELMRLASVAFTQLFEIQIQSNEVRSFLNSTHNFDLLISQSIVPVTLAFSHYFETPVIQISSCLGIYENYNKMGAPANLLYYPDKFRNRIYKLNIFEKIVGICEELFIMSYRWLSGDLNVIIQGLFSADYPSIEDLERQVDVLMLNAHPMWDSNRPVPPGIVYLGNLHQKPQSLSNELKGYLDSSKNGVIYMSFGSLVQINMLPPKVIKVFLNVFARLPYDILLKCNEELPGKPANVRVEKWFPQPDLLRHPKVKLFITQAGLQSTDEAITAGVPLIAFPIVADQWYNAEKYEQFGIGKKMDIGSISEEALADAITTILNDKRYKERITRLGALMRDQPQSPLQRAVWWTEHVLRHRGAAHLRCPAANASWTEYLMLDVVLAILGTVLCFLFLAVYISKRFIRAISVSSARVRLLFGKLKVV